MEEIQKYEPTNLEIFAELVEKSGLFGEKKESVLIKLMLGHALNLHPAQSLRGITIIETRRGREVFIKPLLLASLLRKSGKYRYKILKHDATVCQIALLEKIDNEWQEIGTTEYTIEEAKKQGLAQKENWQNYPREMLFYRCLGRLVRFYLPEIIAGIPFYLENVEEDLAYSAEEVKKTNDLTEILNNPLNPKKPIEELRKRLNNEIEERLSRFPKEADLPTANHFERFKALCAHHLGSYDALDFLCWLFEKNKEELRIVDLKAFLKFFGLTKEQNYEVPADKLPILQYLIAEYSLAQQSPNLFYYEGEVENESQS